MQCVMFKHASYKKNCARFIFAGFCWASVVKNNVGGKKTMLTIYVNNLPSLLVQQATVNEKLMAQKCNLLLLGAQALSLFTSAILIKHL